MFAALKSRGKSRGFDLEATDLTDPSRVERLIGLLELAFSWTRLGGYDHRSVDEEETYVTNKNTQSNTAEGEQLIFNTTSVRRGFGGVAKRHAYPISQRILVSVEPPLGLL